MIFFFILCLKQSDYCNPGEKIKWYTVSWPSDSLSWEDFRGEVLGATDPTAARKYFLLTK